MSCNALSVFVELLVQQPAAIIVSTVVSVLLGPVVASALVERASEFLPVL